MQLQRVLRGCTALIVGLASAAGCGGSEEPTAVGFEMSELSVAQKLPRYALIRDSARSRGIDNAYMFAGIANDETGLAMCWSEATWACQGPASPSCGGGPIIAGSGDGPCNIQQGGLGMFQFDAGTYAQTLARYGSDVLTLDGQMSHAIDYVVDMVRSSVYTTNAETTAKARAWLNNFDVHNPTLRDQWIKTVIRYYNGCQPTSGCWNARYQTYSEGLDMAINEPGGLGFWGTSSARATHIAFQANTSSLWTTGTAGTHDWQLGLAGGTSPSIAGLPGGFEVAFQANTGNLWTAGTAEIRDWHLGMAPGTSPSITALAGGGYQIAFQANTGSLWTTGSAGTRDWSLGMAAGTSPSITALAGGGFEVAFQANTGELWTAGDAGTQNWHLGLRSGTSPSIAGLAGGGFEIAFQANTGNLWTVGSAHNGDRQLGMAAATSPSITALTNGGFQVAFQANTGSLWTTGSNGTHDWQLGMKASTSPGIQALANGRFLVTFQANTGSLWKAGDDGIADLQLGLAAPTSPSAN